MKYPGVEHLRLKQCWICLQSDGVAGESSEEAQSVAKEEFELSAELTLHAQNLEGVSMDTSPDSLTMTATPDISKHATLEHDFTTRWVHPCQCSLVAHESCLLTWINASPTPMRPVCPMCKTPFALEQSSRWLTSLFPLFHTLEHTLLQITFPVGATGIVASLWYLLMQHGRWACRLFFVGNGDDVLGEISWDHAWAQRGWWRDVLEMPLIPITLICSRLTILEPLHPIVPLLMLRRAQLGMMWPYRNFHQLFTLDTTWPPTARSSILLLSTTQAFYRPLRFKFRRWILKTFAGVPVSNLPYPVTLGAYWRQLQWYRTEATGPEADNMQTPIVDQDGNVPGTPIQPADPPAYRLLPRVTIGIEHDAGVVDPGVDANEPGQLVIRTSAGSITRSIIGSLILPQIAYSTGRLLVFLSNRSRWLQILLGLKLTNTISPTHGILHRLGLSSRASSVNAVWWHTILGGLLYVLARDSLTLWYDVAAIRWRSERTVANRPFDKIDISELDLIPNWQNL